MTFILEGFLKAWVLLSSGDPATYSAVFISLRVTSLSMALSLSFGLPAGFCLGYYSFPGKRQIRAAVDALLSIPTVVVGLFVYAFITYRGPFGRLGLLFTIPGIAIAQALLVFPIIASLTATAVETLDLRLRMTLLTFGAGRRRTFFTTLYEARFAVLAAAVTAYGRALSEVGISTIIGGNIKWRTRTITTTIALEAGKGEFGMGIALGIVLLILAFSVNWGVSLLKRRV